MKKLISLSLLLIGLGSLSAQSFVGKLNYYPEKARKFSASSDTLRILAVMVEFQKYKDPTTSGDGTFGSIYTQAYGDTILDPLPFDQKYFSNHLEFAKNYFQKVSNGKLNIVYTVLPQVITVSDSMRDYSPPPQKSSDLTNLGKFAKEVWQIAGTKFTDVDFSKYDLFTIFHAGVGREFAAPGSLGNERDLPSVYLGSNSLKNIFGGSFTGFPINGGNFQIDNTMILPSTESREVSTYGGKQLVQLTINGLIVSSIASHLGLPDLFNTSTGTTAISRFGLMDGSSIFAYSGLFPPEPSAWEKIYLGWAQPVTLSVVNKRIDVVARSVAAMSDTTILKVPINSTEYYLIENRQRDAEGDGLKLTYVLDGQTKTFSIDKDKGRFQWYGVDTVKGVVTDVDDFDWAVPGNGILIWHIDENIINNNIADDKINADLNHRGVYVEEADGIFDIGVAYTSITGDIVYGDGYQEDMWYAGNKGKYFQNKFGPDTKPNTNTNEGANSLITMQNFSAPANKMGFNISFSNSNISLVSSLKLGLSNSNNLLTSTGFSNFESVIAIDNSTLNEFNAAGNKFMTFLNFTTIQPVAGELSNLKFIIGAKGSIVNVLLGPIIQAEHKSLDMLSNVTSLAVDKNNPDNVKLLIGTSNGSVYSIRLDSLLTIQNFDPGKYLIYKGDDSIIGFAIDAGHYTFLESQKLVVFSGSQGVVSPLEANAKKMIMTKDASGHYTYVVLLSGNTFQIIGAYNSIFQIKTNNAINSFAMADLKGDGQNYILVSDGSYLEAYSLNGNLADNFPFTISSGDYFVGCPLVADINNDKIPEVLGFSNNGSIYAVNPLTGKLIDGFPISTGTQISTTPAIFGTAMPSASSLPTYQTYFSVIDESNQLYTWSLGVTSGVNYWSSEFGNSTNTSFIQAPSTTNQVTDFFPLDKAYNYPNPVYGGQTKIRYYVSENSNVQIKIFDLAGGLVADLSGQAAGGFDNETTWDVSKVQSGIYYAHLQVDGVSGKSASKIIKIAVIK